MNLADKIFSIKTEQEFEQVALEVFRFQAERCAPYKQYIELLGAKPCEVKSIEQIPFLPIEFFKTFDIYCGEGEPEKVFTSSNTGGTVASRHAMQSLAHYERTFTAAFEKFYGATERWSIYGLGFGRKVCPKVIQHHSYGDRRDEGLPRGVT